MAPMNGRGEREAREVLAAELVVDVEAVAAQADEDAHDRAQRPGDQAADEEVESTSGTEPEDRT